MLMFQLCYAMVEEQLKIFRQQLNNYTIGFSKHALNVVDIMLRILLFMRKKDASVCTTLTKYKKYVYSIAV